MRLIISVAGLCVLTFDCALALGCGGVSVEDDGEGGSNSATQASSTHASSTHVTQSAAETSSTGSGLPFDSIEFGGSLISQPSQGPLGGAEVCVLDHPEAPCSTTKPDGSFSLSVPSDAETGITIVKPGSAQLVIPVTTAQNDQPGWIIGVPTEAKLTAFYAPAGVTYPDPAQGFVTVFATMGNSQSGKPGVVVTLAPPAEGDALYADMNGNYDATLDATTTRPEVRFVTSPSNVEVDVADPDGNCTANFGGWIATSGSAARVPVKAGFMTHVGFACP